MSTKNGTAFAVPFETVEKVTKVTFPPKPIHWLGKAKPYAFYLR